MANEIRNVTARFYKFAKKPNSTRRPSASTPMYEAHIEIVEPFDLLNPVIKVRDVQKEDGTWTDFMQFNYLYIPEGDSGIASSIDRYYWIKNWRRQGGLYYADCEVDPLASWRGVIHGSAENPNEQLVERSSVAFNNTLRDAYRFNTSNISSTTGSFSLASGSWGYSVDNIMMQIFPSATTGTISPEGLYRLDYSGYITFTGHLGDFLSYKDIEADKVMFSDRTIGDFVGEAWKLPYTPESYGTRLSQMGFGRPDDLTQPSILFDVADSSQIIATRGDGDNQIDIATFSLSTSSLLRGEDWLNTDEYTTLQVSFKPFGTFSIPMHIVKNTDTIYIKIVGDNFGNVTAYVDTTAGQFIIGTSNVAYYIGRSTSSNVSTSQWQEAKGRSRRMSWEKGISTLGGAISNPVGAIASGVNMIISAKDTVADQMESILGDMRVTTTPTSSSTIIDAVPTYTITQQNVTPAQNNKYGRPLHATRALHTLVASGNNSGYVQCSDANIEYPSEDYAAGGTNGGASMTITEKTAICNYLNGGVYLE